MEQFSLEKYLANPSRKVVTKDGRPVRILCTDRISYNVEIVGLIMNNNGMESIFTWTQQGKQYVNTDTPNDLFFAPVKHEGWINVYEEGSNRYLEGCIYATKEEAKRIRGYGYLTTIKIEWEE